MKNFLESESGNLPKELVLKALYSLNNPKDIANLRVVNSIFKALIDNDPKLNVFVQNIKQSLNVVYADIESTSFKEGEKKELKHLLEHEIYQKHSTLCKNKTQQEKIEAWKDLKDMFCWDIYHSWLYKHLHPHIEENNRLFLRCAALGFLGLVEQLLKRKEINPAYCRNYAISYASRNGHPKVVKRLLQDKRVDPADDDNQAICFASRNGHKAVVKALLNHHLATHPELSIEELKASYTYIWYGVDITEDKAFIDAIEEIKLESLVQQDPLLFTQYANTPSPTSKEEPELSSPTAPKSNKYCTLF